MSFTNYFDTDFTFGSDEKQVLQNLLITENNPGTILKDFEILLDFIDSHKIEVTKTHNHLPLKFLNPLNAQLTQPIKLELQRPQQKSFPNIEGLYLILRSTGLGVIDLSGGKPILVLDKEALQLWHKLVSTERYFTLLETWLIKSQANDILGDHVIFNEFPLKECLSFWRQFPDKGIKIAGNKEFESSIRYSPGLFNIALFELFGLSEIQHGKPEPGKGWQISRIQRTALGDAVFKLLFEFYITTFKDILDDQNFDNSFEKLQPTFQPFFPEWRNNLILPEVEFKDGIHTFKVSIGKIWRRIAIPAEMSLDDLCDVILNAFEFDKDHLYRFTYKDRFGNNIHVDAPQFEDPPFTTEVTIGELPLQVGSSMTFLFDFGDMWEFDVKLESINPVDISPSKAKIIEKHGESFPQYHWDEDEWDE